MKKKEPAKKLGRSDGEEGGKLREANEKRLDEDKP